MAFFLSGVKHTCLCVVPSSAASVVSVLSFVHPRTLGSLQVGDLMIEYILQEIAPKHQPCILGEHDGVGAAFHLVAGCIYRVKVNIFREGPGLRNPVARAHELTLTTADGTPLRLPLSAVAAPADATPLPHCMHFEALWDPRACQSQSLLEATKWPETRSVQVALALELHGPTGRLQTVSTDLFFQVHAKETVGLRAKRVKEWARDEYLKLTPGTRAAISGALAVAKVAAKAGIGLGL